jgi:hypothetical protein
MNFWKIMFNFLMAPVILLKLDQKRNSHRVDALSFMSEFQTFWRLSYDLFSKWNWKTNVNGVHSSNFGKQIISENGRWNVVIGGYGTCGNQKKRFLAVSTFGITLIDLHMTWSTKLNFMDVRLCGKKVRFKSAYVLKHEKTFWNLIENGKWNVVFGGYGTCGNWKLKNLKNHSVRWLIMGFCHWVDSLIVSHRCNSLGACNVRMSYSEHWKF